MPESGHTFRGEGSSCIAKRLEIKPGFLSILLSNLAYMALVLASADAHIGRKPPHAFFQRETRFRSDVLVPTEILTTGLVSHMYG